MKKALAACAILLVGCSNLQMQQQMQAQREMNERKQQELQAATAECRNRWESDRRIDPVRAKLPLFPGEASLAQRGNQERATEQEKGAIEAADDVGRWCQQRAAEILSRYVSAQQMALLYRAQGEIRSLRADLWGGKLTYGEALTQADAVVRKLVSDDATLVAEINQRTASLQAQQVQAEAARQQASSAATTQALQGLYLMNQSRQPAGPTITNCDRFGQGISCTTWQR